MKWQNDGKKQSGTTRGSLRRLRTFFRAYSTRPNLERKQMDSKRGGDTVGPEGQAFNQRLSGVASSSHEQFINDKCEYCKHIKGMHFVHTDQIGTWAFCVIHNCDCFSDFRDEENAPA